jgi:hypothetical protein
MNSFRSIIFATSLTALGAFTLPWFTHFADGGLSILLLVVWFACIVFGFWNYRARAAWLLLSAPLALYWPVVLALWVSSDDVHFGF